MYKDCRSSETAERRAQVIKIVIWGEDMELAIWAEGSSPRGYEYFI